MYNSACFLITLASFGESPNHDQGDIRFAYRIIKALAGYILLY